MNPQDYKKDKSSDHWRAPSDDMRIRRTLAKRVGSSLSRNEQETSIHFFGDSKRFKAITHRPSLTRAFLRHDYADINWVDGHKNESRVGRMPFHPADMNSSDPTKIEGISVSLPIGTLLIKGMLRASDHQCAIVSTPEEARAAAEAFAGDEE
jgi:hypothetical protein